MPPAGATEPHVAVIGAGPGGLATAYCLGRRGIAYTLIERGPSILTGLRRIDPGMQLLSPRAVSRLPGMGRAPSFDRRARRGRRDRGQAATAAYWSFADYVARLEGYAADHRITAVVDTAVTRVRRDGRGFALELRRPDGGDGTLHATHVVNCAGIISTPRLPAEFDPRAVRWRWKHSLDVRAGDLAGARRLLVVGGGASAAEVLELWLDVRGDAQESWLSLRSPLFAFTNPILGLDVHCWIWLPERLPSRWFGRRASRLREAMNGSRVLPAVRRGLIRKVPAAALYDGWEVRLVDGRSLAPDLVVFATGFRYTAAHLDGLVGPVRRCESTATPGLYLLGYRFGRSFASPYIRGLGRDAAFVARRIARTRSIGAKGWETR